MPFGPGIATLPQPAKYANSRGSKSRAGLKPACVSGANTEISIEIVRPMNRGTRCGDRLRSVRTSAEVVRYGRFEKVELYPLPFTDHSSIR